MGINAQVFMQQDPSSATQNRHLNAMRADGMQVIRFDALWGRVQSPTPVPGRPSRFAWGYYDHWIKRLAVRGLRWLPILDYSAPWATSMPGREKAPPKTVATFARYARAFGARYGTGGNFWRKHPELPQLPVTTYEIWNEPNFRVFWGGRAPDPGRYAQLFLAAEHALSQVDPLGRVIVGGLAGRSDAPDYLRQMYRARPALRSHVDGVGFHLYAPTPEEMYTRIRAMRETVDAVDSPEVPIEITEIGWSARTPPEERQRAIDIARVATALPASSCRVGLFLPHTWTTPQRSRAPGEWFGLFNANATAKASGTAYIRAIAVVAAALPPQDPDPCG